MDHPCGGAHTDPPRALSPLCPRGERPHDRRAADECDELATVHAWITLFERRVPAGVPGKE
jgi:hypothetical protein